jgi:protein TonB
MKNHPGFDDLVFEFRNREYGAYQLRKKYNSALTTGIILASLVVSAFMILSFNLTSHYKNVITGDGSYISVQMEKFEPPKEVIYLPPSPPPAEAVLVEKIVKYFPPVVVDSLPEIEKSQLTTEEYLKQTTEINNRLTGSDTGDALLSGQEGTDAGEPLLIVEVMPSFKGGSLDRFSEWVQKMTNYPKEAADNRIQGTVVVTFVVEKDGKVSNVAILKGVHPLLDNEALKVISSSPEWRPGLQGGQAVRIRYLIPIVFSPF